MRQLNCIVCDRELEAALPEPIDHNQPYEGTAFTSQGHYGSTIFDPMDGTYLEINVCDGCLDTAAKNGQVLLVKPIHTRQDFLYEQWEGRHDLELPSS